MKHFLLTDSPAFHCDSQYKNGSNNASSSEVNDKDDDTAVELGKKIDGVKTGIEGDDDTCDVDDAESDDDMESDDGIVRSEVVTDGYKVDVVLLGTINYLVNNKNVCMHA